MTPHIGGKGTDVPPHIPLFIVHLPRQQVNMILLVKISHIITVIDKKLIIFTNSGHRAYIRKESLKCEKVRRKC